MAQATDTVWLPVLPSMKGFGPALVAGAGKQATLKGRLLGTTFGRAILSGAAFAGAGIAAFGAVLYNTGRTFEDVNRTIAVGTGATGKALEGLVDDAKAIGQQIPASFSDISESVAILNTLTGASGETLQDLSIQVMEASRLLGEDGVANSEAFGKALSQWQIPAEDGGPVMDKLFKATQDYGIGLDEVMKHLNKYGPVLQNAGFEMDESVALFGQLNAAGIDVRRTMPGLSQAFRDWAGEGKDVQSELSKTVSRIKDAETSTDALAIATEVFGSEGAQTLTTAIRSGALELDDLSTALDGAEGLIADTAAQTMTWQDHWMKFKNNVMVWLEPLATRTMKLLADGMAGLVENVNSFVSAFQGGQAEGFFGRLGQAARDAVDRLREFGQWIADNRQPLSGIASVIGGLVGAFLLYRGAVAGVTAIKAGYVGALALAIAAQRGLNAAMRANPIGLVVTLIGGLVAGLTWFFTRTETGQRIWERVWSAIRTATSAVVDWFTGTALPILQRVWDGIAAGARWLYERALLPAWRGIRSAISMVVGWISGSAAPNTQSVFQRIGSFARWLWQNAILPAWRGIQSAISATVSWIRDTGWPIAQRVFRAIASVVSWLWRNVAQPAWAAMQVAFRVLSNAIRTVWTRVLQPAFRAVGAVIGWLWNNVAKPLFAFIWERFQRMGRTIRAIWQGVIRPVIRLLADIILWLWRNVVRPHFRSIWELFQRLGRFFTAVWRNVLRPMFRALGNFIRDTWRDRIRPAFTAIRDGFSWLRDRLRDIWRNRIRPIFQAVGDFVRNNLVDRIKRGVELIRDAWNRVANFFRTPINWVINTVWNKGIRAAFNRVAEAVESSARLAKVDTIPKFGGGGGSRGASGGIGAVNARAKGGYTPQGWTLVGEEGPELVDFRTPGRVYTAAQSRDMLSSSGDVPPEKSQWLAGASPAEALLPMGGWISRAVSWAADKASSVLSWVRGGLAKAAEALLMPILKPVSAKMAGFGKMGQLGSGLIDSSVDRLIDWIKGEDDKAGAFGEDGSPFDGERGSFFRPSRGPITSWFGPRWGTIHSGIDIAGGGPTYAAYAGRVARTGWNVLPGRTGLGILLNHGGGLTTYYGHNPVGGIRVSPGDQVKRGQRIGAQGATGNVTGIHLHWERLQNGRAQNVNSMFRDKGGLIYPGVNQVLNNTGGAEYISNQRQFDNLNRMAENATAGQGLTVHQYGMDYADSRAVVNEFSRATRRAARGGALVS